MFVNECGGPLLCSTGLPLMVLLLYWAELPLAVLGPSVLNKGVEIDLIRTQLSPTCAWTIPSLPGVMASRYDNKTKEECFDLLIKVNG